VERLPEDGAVKEIALADIYRRMQVVCTRSDGLTIKTAAALVLGKRGNRLTLDTDLPAGKWSWQADEVK
jgi:hypothetical protein